MNRIEDASELTIDDLAYMVVGRKGPNGAIIDGELVTVDDIAKVFEKKREELNVGHVGDNAVSQDGRLTISYSVRNETTEGLNTEEDLQ